MFRLMKKHDSISKRIILLAITIICFCMLLTGGFIIWSFQKSQERIVDSYLSAYIDTLISVTSLDSNGRVVVKDNVSLFNNMPFYWEIFLDGEGIKASNVILPEDIKGMKIIKRDYLFPGNQSVTYKFGMPKQIVDALVSKELNKLMESTAVFLVVLAFVFIVLLAALQILLIVRPLKFIKDEIVDIHEGRKSKLENVYPKEINMLAEEVNKLIGYNISIIERYRTFAANLSHALKTPLTVINNETQKSSGKLAKVVKEKSSDMLELIDRNLNRVNAVGANSAISANIDVIVVVDKVSNSFAKLYEKKVEVIRNVEEAIFQGNESDLYEIVGNIIENACKYSKSRLDITIDDIEGNITITIEDDGSGIAESEINNVLNHGTRLDNTKPGYGIGLAVANDIVALYGGNLSFTKSDNLGGLKAVITLNS